MNLSHYIQWRSNAEFKRFINSVDDRSYHANDDEFISDMLNDKEILQWRCSTPIFLTGPCSAGKNYFIEEYAKQHPTDKILILVPRVALASQAKRRMHKVLKGDNATDYYTEKGIYELERIENVSVMNYHKFFFIEKHMKYDLVFCDEVDQIYTGSSYWPYSSEILDRIIRLRESIRVYVTATPEHVFGEILAREIDALSILERTPPNLFVEKQKRLHPIFYNFQKNVKLYERIRFFWDIEDLIPQIVDSQEQWLFFAETISETNEIEELLKSTGKSIVKINSFSKNPSNESYEEYVRMLEEEKFEASLCLTTRVIDAGINLKMDKLANLILTSGVLQQELVNQLIGRRRRIRRSDNVTVWIQLPSKQVISDKLNYYRILQGKICSLKSMNQTDLDYLFNTGKIHEYENLYYLLNGKVRTNPLALKQCENLIEMYEMLLENYDSCPYGVALLVMHWLNPCSTEFTFSEDMVLMSSDEKMMGRKAIEDFLETYVDKELKDGSKEGFRQNFMSLYLNYFDRVNTTRTDRIFGNIIITQKIDELGLPYKIEVNGGIWKIIKEGEQDE